MLVRLTQQGYCKSKFFPASVIRGPEFLWFLVLPAIPAKAIRVENTRSTKQAPSPGWVAGLLPPGQHARVGGGKRTVRGLGRAPAAPSPQDLGGVRTQHGGPGWCCRAVSGLPRLPCRGARGSDPAHGCSGTFRGLPGTPWHVLLRLCQCRPCRQKEDARGGQHRKTRLAWHWGTPGLQLGFPSSCVEICLRLVHAKR